MSGLEQGLALEKIKTQNEQGNRDSGQGSYFGFIRYFHTYKSNGYQDN
jgi:hypothetical protein